MKKKSFDWKIVCGVLLMVVIVAFLLFINTFLYAKTNLLIFYFFDVCCKDSFCVWLCILLIFLNVMYDMKKKDEKFKATKPFVIFFAISVVGLLVVNLFPVSKAYSEVMIDGKRPSKIGYKLNLLCDVVLDSTATDTIDTKDMEIFENSYTYRTRRAHRRTQRSYYVVYKVNFNTYYSLEEKQIAGCIANLMLATDTIEIEYYPNSGIIKSVNGIAKNEYELLRNSVSKIENDKDEQKDNEEIDNEANELAAAYLMQDCVGKTLMDVQKQFEENEINFNYNITYISSQIFAIDQIAFFEEGDVYVVNDNSKEDLVAFPRLKAGMTKSEIIDVLTEAGFDYECDEFECSNCGKNKLHTVGYSAGTLIPKGHKVWFSVDE